MQKIIYIGLGKMGLGMTKRLVQKKYQVFAHDPDPRSQKIAHRQGVIVKNNLPDLLLTVKNKRLIWLMVPHQVVSSVIRTIKPFLKPGDTIIDGGNSPFWESEKRSKILSRIGVSFLDVGVSGGPGGARHGACLMIGGAKTAYEKNRKLFNDLALKNSYAYLGKAGSGHFVKMIHNGIEYGMMQSIAEGFEVMKKSKFNLKLEEVAGLYNQGSVIESRLIGWLEKALNQQGQDLTRVSSKVSHSGEGEWTVRTAKKLKVKTPAIESALAFRKHSGRKKSYTGKVLSALRNQFGGHNFKK